MRSHAAQAQRYTDTQRPPGQDGLAAVTADRHVVRDILAERRLNNKLRKLQ